MSTFYCDGCNRPRYRDTDGYHVDADGRELCDNCYYEDDDLDAEDAITDIDPTENIVDLMAQADEMYDDTPTNTNPFGGGGGFSGGGAEGTFGEPDTSGNDGGSVGDGGSDASSSDFGASGD